MLRQLTAAAARRLPRPSPHPTRGLAAWPSPPRPPRGTLAPPARQPPAPPSAPPKRPSWDPNWEGHRGRGNLLPSYGRALVAGRGKFFLIVAVGWGTAYYAAHQDYAPYTNRRRMIDLSPEDEAALGEREFNRLVSSSPTHPPGAPSSLLVTRVARRIAAVVPPSPTPFDWRFVVIAAPGVVNAACYPGGKVVVFSGLLDALPPGREGEAELAAVLAHEIGHAVARHSAEKLSFANLVLVARAVLFFLLDAGTLVDLLINVAASLPMSRAMEAEADFIGLRLMAAACYDPAAAARFFQRLDQMAVKRGTTPPAFLSTHPSDKRRIEQIQGWLPDVASDYTLGCSRRTRVGVQGLEGAVTRQEGGRGGWFR